MYIYIYIYICIYIYNICSSPPPDFRNHATAAGPHRIQQ